MAAKAATQTFKRHKESGSIYHAESSLVVKSATDKHVTGRIENGKLVELDQEALDLCEKFGFQPDPELISEEVQEDEQTPSEPEVKVEPKVDVKVEPKPEPKVEQKPKVEPAKPPKVEVKTAVSDSPLAQAISLLQQVNSTETQLREQIETLKKELEVANQKVAKYTKIIKSLSDE